MAEPRRRLPAAAGAGWATRLSSTRRCKVTAALLVLIAVALLFGQDAEGGGAVRSGPAQRVAGVAVGFGIAVRPRPPSLPMTTSFPPSGNRAGDGNARRGGIGNARLRRARSG